LDAGVDALECRSFLAAPSQLSPALRRFIQVRNYGLNVLKSDRRGLAKVRILHTVLGATKDTNMLTSSLATLIHTAALIALAPNAPHDSHHQDAAPDETGLGSAACERFYHVFRALPASCLAPIDTDRPHQTDTPHVVDPGHVQFESAVVSLEADTFRSNAQRSLILGDNLYKVGLLNGVDLQMFYTTYAREGSTSSFGDTLAFRAKFQIWGNNRTTSSLSLVPLVIAPLKAAGTVEGGAQVFFGSELPAELDWELNLGGVTQTIEGKRRALPIASTALTRDVTEDLAVFGEARETSTDADLRVWDTYLDTGLLYHITRDVQVDAGGYFGVTGNAPALTLFTGFSVRQ
jgi:hypothetical protein